MQQDSSNILPPREAIWRAIPLPKEAIWQDNRDTLPTMEAIQQEAWVTLPYTEATRQGREFLHRPMEAIQDRWVMLQLCMEAMPPMAATQQHQTKMGISGQELQPPRVIWPKALASPILLNSDNRYREYWTIYRGPGFLAVIWFGSTPNPHPPVSKLHRRHKTTEKERQLADGKGGRGRPPHESLTIYRSFNPLWGLS